jgi:hypothetical protein
MLILKGNNGDGFDMNQSTLDGMTIAKPDKSQSYTIPNTLQKSQLLINNLFIRLAELKKLIYILFKLY